MNFLSSKDTSICMLLSDFSKHQILLKLPYFLIFSTSDLKNNNGWRKFYSCYRVYSFGIDRTYWSEGCALCVIPSDLHSYLGRESGHDSLNPNHPKASHTHVLFPQLPFTCGCLLFISHCTKNADQLLGGKSNHLLLWLHSTAFVFWGAHYHRSLLALSDGLWLLCGHCQSFALQFSHI